MLAYYGLGLLIALIAGGVALTKTTPTEAARICYQELAQDGAAAVCPRDFTAFTMPDNGEHLMVRR
jgi:hypothetical protein